MHNGIKEDNSKILSVNFGFINSPELIKKSLWWISKNFQNKEIIAIGAIDDNNISEEIIEKINYYAANISWKLIKTNSDVLARTYGIDSYGKSLDLSYKVCNKFSSKRKIITSQQIIYPYNVFHSFLNSMENNKIKTINTYFMPKYVQEGLTDLSSNFSEYLAIECRKYPINTKDFPPKNIDYVAKCFYESEQEKEIDFVQGEAFYMEKDEIQQQEIKFENLDLLIDKTIKEDSTILERTW